MTKQPGNTHGVFFSANDKVLAWSVPFLTSFRIHNPEMPLCLIPFDQNVSLTKALADQFDFSIFEHDSFGALEQIGRKLELGHSEYGPHWFRRYASFWGPFDRFLYLDARQVILSDLTEFVTAPERFGLEFVYYDTVLNQVYEPGPMRCNLLVKGGARGFNSGRWASQKGLFSLTSFQKSAQVQLSLRDQLNARNTDQAFINFCCDEAAVNMAKISDLLGDVVSSGWARQSGHPYQDDDGIWRLWDHGGNDHKRRLLLMHWAGYRMEDPLPHARLLRRYGGRSRTSLWASMRKFLAANRKIRKLIGRPA
ncbi:MAG: hypothetical protein AAGL97_02895 [Pseudomonadota bacterium]